MIIGVSGTMAGTLNGNSFTVLSKTATTITINVNTSSVGMQSFG
jgi:hypothetical protein